MANQNNLELVLKAVDKASPTLRAITAQVHKLTSPLQNVTLFSQFEGLGKALNVSGIRDGVAGVAGAVGRVGGEVSSLIGKLTGIGLAGGLAFAGLIHGAMEAGDKLGEVSARVGLTADQFGSLQYSAAQSDVEAEAFVESMDKLNKQMGDMTVGKGGAFLAFLNEISPTFAKQMKGAKNTEEALRILGGAFAKLENPEKRAKLSAEAFGKSGKQMGEWLHSGSAAIDEQRKRFAELVGTQEQFVQRAGELDNATRETGYAFQGLRNTFATAFFPVLTEFANKVTGFLTQNRDGIKAWAEKTAAAVQAWVDGGGFERLIATLGRVADSIGRVVDWLGPMGTALAGVGVLALPTIAAFGSLATSVITLAVEAFPALYAAGAALWPVISAGATALWGMVAPLGTLMLEFAPVLLLVGSLVFLAKTLRDNWEPLVDLFRNFGETVRNTINAIFGDGRFEKLMEWVTNPTKTSLFDGLFGATKADAAEADYQRALAKDGEDRKGLAFRPREFPGRDLESAFKRGLEGVPQEQQGGFKDALEALRHDPNNAAARAAIGISVDFTNLPRGAKVSIEPNSSQPVDLSLGYASAF